MGAVGVLSLLASTVPRILRKHGVERTSLCCSGLTVKWLPSALLAEVSLFYSLVHAPPHLRPSVPKLLAALASFRMLPSRSLLVRRTRLPLPTTRDVFPKTKSNAWSPKPRSTRPRMTPTATVSKPRTVLRTTATPSRDPSVVTKLLPRWTQPTRLPWKQRLKRPSAGSTATLLPKRKNTKRGKRNSKVLLCLSFKRWEVPPEPEVWAVCPIWEVCLEELLALLLPRTLLEDLPLKKSIKRFAFLY